MEVVNNDGGVPNDIISVLSKWKDEFN